MDVLASLNVTCSHLLSSAMSPIMSPRSRGLGSVASSDDVRANVQWQLALQSRMSSVVSVTRDNPVALFAEVLLHHYYSFHVLMCNSLMSQALIPMDITDLHAQQLRLEVVQFDAERHLDTILGYVGKYG